MGDFLRMAEIIARRIEQVPIGTRELNDIVGSNFDSMNCYPGQKTDVCCLDAVFISLSSKYHRKGRGHLYLEEALEALTQHLKEKCKGTTKSATLITDYWSPKEFIPYREIIELFIDIGIQIEIYLLVQGRAIQIHKNGGGL